MIMLFISSSVWRMSKHEPEREGLNHFHDWSFIHFQTLYAISQDNIYVFSQEWSIFLSFSWGGGGGGGHFFYFPGGGGAGAAPRPRFLFFFFFRVWMAYIPVAPVAESFS